MAHNTAGDGLPITDTLSVLKLPALDTPVLPSSDTRPLLGLTEHTLNAGEQFIDILVTIGRTAPNAFGKDYWTGVSGLNIGIILELVEAADSRQSAFFHG